MHQTLFRSWKVAAIWVFGICSLIAAFFADGGGHEQFAESAQHIRDKRSNPHREDAEKAAPTPVPTPAPKEAAEEEEEAEPAFGEPMMSTGEDEAPPEPDAPASQASQPAAPL